MKKEFLQDYQAKELEYAERFKQKVLSGTLAPTEKYPDRFNRPLKEPVVVADMTTYYSDKEKIWSQIPFAGTLIIPLQNYKRENLLNFNAFEEGDIPKLIDLAKQTGRVQFVLGTHPILFEGLDHLDPIFQELSPPTYRTLPIDAFAEKKQIALWEAQFLELSNIAYLRYKNERLKNIEGGLNYLVASLWNRKEAYLMLKILKMDWLSDAIENWLIDDPALADRALYATHLATGPLLGRLADATNHTINKIKWAGMDSFGSSMSTPHYPIEIGRFLLQKLTINPTNYSGCMDVIQHYEQNELYKILKSLDTGVKEQSMDAVVRDVKELNMIMDNIWQTASRITRAGKVIQGGVRIAIGLAGFGLSSALLPPPVASAMGLLAQLGINAADKFIEGKNLGENAAKLLNKKYITTIYDFGKKHSLT